jgi:phage-related protein (TIGR01555 family)
MAGDSFLERFDGWLSTVMGFGTTRDKITSLYFEPTILNFDQCQMLWRGDDMAARAVEVWPKQMLRVPFNVTIADNKDAEVKVNDQFKTLGLAKAFKRAIEFQRAYGGGAILLGIKDSLGMEMPVEPGKVLDIEWLNVLQPRQLTPSDYYDDPRHPKFGKVKLYRIATTSAAAQTNLHVIHESRLLIFDGIRTLDGKDFQTSTGWGDSVLNRMYNVLRGYGMTWDSAYHLMSDNSQGIYKMKGLVEMLKMGGGAESLMAKRMRAIDLSRSVMRSIMVDADSEDFTRVSTPMTGVAEMLDRVGHRLSAAADMPYTILLGESPGGLGSNGNAEITAFYDRVDAMRVEMLEPQILRVATLLATKYKVTTPIAVSFAPLWTPTELEKAQARNTQANTDVAYINAGVADPDEIANSRFGRGGYSFETTIDFEARTQANSIFSDGESSLGNADDKPKAGA